MKPPFSPAFSGVTMDRPVITPESIYPVTSSSGHALAQLIRAAMTLWIVDRPVIIPESIYTATSSSGHALAQLIRAAMTRSPR